MSKRNRNAGHNWERECVELLKQIFPHITTCRSESRSRDNQKVDLINKDEFANGRLPFSMQCKTTQRSVNYHKLISEMPADREKIILHKQTKKSKGGKFITKGKYAIIEMDTLIRLLHNYRPVLIDEYVKNE